MHQLTASTLSTTSAPSHVLGSFRSFEHVRAGSLTPEQLDQRVATLEGELDALTRHHPELAQIATAKLHNATRHQVSYLLEQDGWELEEGRVLHRQVNAHHKLVGILHDDGAITLMGQLDRFGMPRFMDKLGLARGFESIALLLTCIRVEFGAEENTLTEEDIAKELARRKSFFLSRDVPAHQLEDQMRSVCEHDEFDAWLDAIDQEGHRHKSLRGEVSCFREWVDGRYVYQPVSSVDGSLCDDCSSIFVATTARFDTADRARAWATARLNRPSAYYDLSPAFQYKYSGKTWGKYS